MGNTVTLRFTASGQFECDADMLITGVQFEGKASDGAATVSTSPTIPLVQGVYRIMIAGMGAVPATEPGKILKTVSGLKVKLKKGQIVYVETDDSVDLTVEANPS